jgi:replication factor A1
MDLEKIVKKIAGESGLEEKEIKDRIENKQKELGGLITSEGAAHVVANEVGINLFEGVAKTHDLNIENIIPDMNSVDVVGRVLRIYGPREFDKKDGSKGKVCSLVLGDGTGTIRTVFWGKDTGLIEEGKIVEDSIIRIKGGYTKENINGEAEIHIGTKTRVILNPKDVRQEDIPLPEERKKKIAE